MTLVQKHEPFRIAELNALLEMNGLTPAEVYSLDDYDPATPYLVCNFPTEAQAVSVCDRGILVRDIMELWAGAATYPEVAAQALRVGLGGGKGGGEGGGERGDEGGRGRLAPFTSAERSWALRVDAFGRTLSVDEQATARAHFRPLLEELKVYAPS